MTAERIEKPETSQDTGQNDSYVLSIALAALAGSVDAIGFVHWHGLFVSFMSGNSTILGAASAGGDWRDVEVSLLVISGFVAGVVLGEVLSDASGAHAKMTVLFTEAVMLSCGAYAASLGQVESVAAPLLSIAMGVQNASVHRAAGVSVALTYVTGTLVHLGRSLAKALQASGPWSGALPFLGLWCALVTGAVIGARITLVSEMMALAAAAIATSLLGAVMFAASFVHSRSLSGS